MASFIYEELHHIAKQLGQFKHSQRSTPRKLRLLENRSTGLLNDVPSHNHFILSYHNPSLFLKTPLNQGGSTTVDLPKTKAETRFYPRILQKQENNVNQFPLLSVNLLMIMHNNSISSLDSTGAFFCFLPYY